MAGKGGLALSEERRAKIFQWLDVHGANDPTAEAAFRKSLYNLSVQQFRLIKREWKNQQAFKDTLDKKHAMQRGMIKRIIGPTLDPGTNIIFETNRNMYEEENPPLPVRRGKKKRGKVEIPEPVDEDVDTYLKKMDMDVARALIGSCLDGNANAIKLYQQMMGRLVEKRDETGKPVLTADDHFRIREEAKRRISEVVSGAADGGGGVRSEQPILPDEVWKNTAQN